MAIFSSKMKKVSIIVFFISVSICSVLWGQSFTALNGPFLGNVSDLARTTTGTLLAATENGLYRSTDSGATWTRFTLSIIPAGTATNFQDLEINTTNGLIYAASFQNLFTSSDDGATWTFLSTTGLTTTSIRRVEVAPNGNVWVAQSNNTLYRANAATPTTFNTINTFSTTINDLDIGPSNQIVVSTQGNSAQISTNNGLSFSAPASGLGATVTVYSVAINSTGVIFAMAANTIYRSTDNGVNYTDIKNNITDTSFFGFIDTDAAGDVFVANNSFGRIYSVSAAGSLLATPVWSSANYPAGTTISARAGIFQSLTNWQTGFFAFAVARTTDGGTSWTQISNGIKAYNAFGSSVTPRLFRTTTNRLLMGWPGTGYFVSIDDGANWDLLNNAGANLNRNINGFVTGVSNSIIGYGNGGIIRSTDNGQNWTNQSTSPGHAFLTTLGTGLYSFNTTFAPSSVQSSTDNGVTWSNLAITGLPANAFINKFVSTASTLQVLITNTADNGIYSINTTTGACTKNTTIPFIPTDVAVTGDNMVAISGTAMAVSNNAGTSWVSRTISQNALKIWIADERNFFVQSTTAGNFLVSNNSGLNWNSATLGDATASATDAIFTAQGFAYLVGSNMAAQKSNAVVLSPRAPTNLNELSKNSNFVFVSWDDNSTVESKYEVEISVGNNTNYQLSQTTGIINTLQNKTSTTVTADPITPTFVRVRAVNDAGASAYSNEVSVTAMNNVCTPPATDLIPDNRSWTATAVADAGFTPTNAGPFTSSTATIFRTGVSGNLTSGFTDDVRFGMGIPAFGLFEVGANFNERCGITSISGSSFQNNGNGSWNPATKTLTIKWQTNFGNQPFKGTTTYILNPNDPVPVAPLLTTYIYSNTEILLNWESSPFATAYDLERSLTPGSGFINVATLNYPAISFINSGLTTGQTYYYRIRARNATGNSAYSAEVNISPSSSTLFRPIVSAISENFEAQQGASWGDIDGDGDDDLAVPSFTNSLGLTVPPVFYQNLGNSVFQRMDLAALVTENTSVSRGVALFDFDNDNDLDMLIPRSGAGSGASSILLLNNGNWNFSKVLLDQTTPTGTGIGFRGFAIADYDRDGLADAFLGSSGAATQLPTLILKNNGTFNLLTTGVLASDINSAITLLPADYDNDGDQDLFVVNRFSPAIANKLFKNNGDGTFSLVTGLVFDTDLFSNCRTGSWGDIDNDGDLDLYVGTQSGATNKLYQNNGNGTFTSLTSAVAESLPASGSAFGDIDNDGDLDLIVTSFSGVANAIYVNGGTGTFTKSSTQEILVSPIKGNVGAAFSDFDNDGFLDFYTAIIGGSTLPNLLYKNTLSASAARNWIEVKLKGTTSNFAALGARVTVTTASPNRTQIREVMSSTGYGSQNSLTQHFGLGSATTISQIQVRWPNGGTQIITNPSVNQVITITEDVVGPLLTLTPANGSSGVNTGNTLKVTLSEPGSPVAAKNIVVRRDTETGTVVQTLAATAGVASGNEYTYTLASNLLPLTTYFISIDAAAFIDVFSNPSLAVAPANWTFSTLDNVPPVITFSPPATLSKADLSTTVFNVTATDNISISSVVMSYRKVTATEFQTQNGVFNAATNQYSFPLQAAMFNDMGLEYYFEAKDAQPNTTRSPATGNHFTRLTIPESLLTLSISAGSTLSAYKIISVPLDLSTNAVGSLFEELGAPDTKEWRLLKYVNSPQSWNENFQSIARGEGYFIISKAGANIKFGTATSPNFTQSTPFVLNLTQGFNLIGNPYLVPINWNDVRSGIPGVGELKIFQSGVYVNATTDLQPFDGGFVFANAAVNVPVKFKTSTGGRISGKAIGSDLEQNEWIVPIVLSQGNHTFNFGGIGMAKDASFSYDYMDDFSPPALYEKQEIKFEHPEHFMKYFARDIVPTQSEHQWQFTVDTEVAGTAELQWDNTLFGENTNELYLMDVARQVVIDMRTTNRITFDPEKSTMFKIYFGKNLRSKVKPEGVFLGKPFPNPTNTSATIGFTLPENSSAYQVQLEIYNSVGQRTEVLTNGNLQPGFYTSVWDIENNKNGLYFYRLSVSANGVQKVLTEKIIINR